MVEKIDENTQQLARALSEGTSIIITTIQKFPFITRALGTLEAKGEGVKIDTAGKRFAVIVDEAHSSQSGDTATTLRGMLNREGIEATIAAQMLDDEADDGLADEAKRGLLRATLRRSRQPNLSFFAFTATPKFKTLALFDEPGPSGVAPFHEYTMKQAVQEGFILDVLSNYTTYKRYYGLIKKIEGDPEVPRQKAVKELTRFLELHPVNIDQVVSVIVEHFRTSVMHELGGRAKAMIVTGSRLAAVKYKLEFDSYVRKRGYTGIKSLVAFSGEVEDPDAPGKTYTEVAMNDGLSESELPETFDREDYRVLLVAEKYQTGFDQPLLQTMYVVKKLAGVQAVQTLSRLNRIAPGKTRTFVLDFVNDENEIYEAFKPYYETTLVGENADPQKLSELHHKLVEWALFSPDDVNEFAGVWFMRKRDHSSTDHRKMNALLDVIVERFRQRDEADRELIRGQLTAFRNLYAFLSQIIPYQDSELEKFYTFARNLITKLPPPGDGKNYVLDDEVALQYFRLQQITDGSIDLSAGDAKALKGPTDVGSAGKKDVEEALSTLVAKLNERFGTRFTEADQLFFDQIRSTAENDERIVEAARNNNLANFSSYLDRMLDEFFIDRMEGNEEIFSRVMTDKAFRSTAHEHLAQEIFTRAREEASAKKDEQKLAKSR